MLDDKVKTIKGMNMDNEIFHVGATVSDIDYHQRFLTQTLSMKVMSDSGREGEWIDNVTGLTGFKARNVYITPDGINRIEMFQIFRPQLSSVPLTYGTYLGIAHLGINAENFATIADSLQLQSLDLNDIRYDERRGSLFFQDNSGLNWKISQADDPGAGDAAVDNSVNLSHVRVVVSDVQRTLKIYSEFLGLVFLDIKSEAVQLQDMDGRWLTTDAVIYRLRTGRQQILELCQYKDYKPLPNPRRKINCLGLHHLAFKVPDAVTLFTRLQEVGCSAVSDPQHIPMGPNRGGVLFYFYDPDGTILEILQPPAKSS